MIALAEKGVPFERIDIDLANKPDWFLKISPLGKVPVLVDDGFAIWDTLAISEYLAERFPDKQLWPQEPAQRARARSMGSRGKSGGAGCTSSRYSRIASDPLVIDSLIALGNSASASTA